MATYVASTLSLSLSLSHMYSLQSGATRRVPTRGAGPPVGLHRIAVHVVLCRVALCVVPSLSCICVLFSPEPRGGSQPMTSVNPVKLIVNALEDGTNDGTHVVEHGDECMADCVCAMSM